MPEVFPTEEVGAAVTRVVDEVTHVGRYLDDRGVVVVLLPCDAPETALPREVAGYAIQYLWSDLTPAEVQSAYSEIRTIAQAARVSCGIHYDPKVDRVRVSGYFPDPAVAAQLSRIKGVAVVMGPEGSAGFQ